MFSLSFSLFVIEQQVFFKERTGRAYHRAVAVTPQNYWASLLLLRWVNRKASSATFTISLRSFASVELPWEWAKLANKIFTHS
jgi:hypothetical protein